MIDSKTIYAKRMMDKSNPAESNELVNNYYKVCQKICNHEEYVDIGYCKIQNGKYYIVDKEESEFRVLKCTECNKCIMLLRTNNIMWDTLYGNKEIKVITKRSVNHCKKMVLK